VLGRGHALSGAVAGIALGSLVLHEPAGSLAMPCRLTAAFVTCGFLIRSNPETHSEPR
jgi:hypothetical protein